MSAMLKGVKGLLELAGGGRWSRGFIPRLPIASQILTTLVVVIQAFSKVTKLLFKRSGSYQYMFGDSASNSLMLV